MKTFPFAIIAATAGLATANPTMSTGLTEHAVDHAGTPTATMIIDISGYNTWDEQGAAINETLSVLVGAGAVITGIGWDVNITSTGESWASEATLNFAGLINLNPAIDDFPVTNTNYTSGGIIDLTDAGVSNIIIGNDGFLDIEFFESFDDVANAIDSTFEAGSTITIAGHCMTLICPSPGSLAAFGAFGLFTTRRHRSNLRTCPLR